MAVSNGLANTIILYSTVDGAQVTSFGEYGNGPGRFNYPTKLCISPRDTLIGIDSRNDRVQEVTLTGEHIRFIGQGLFGQGLFPQGVQRHLLGSMLQRSQSRFRVQSPHSGIIEPVWGRVLQRPLFYT